MPRPETTANPPRLTRQLAPLLPARWRPLACLGVHTILAGYRRECAVCGQDWTQGRSWLRWHGTRSPERGRGQPSRTTVRLEVAPRTALHRLETATRRGRTYWLAQWYWRGDLREARLRPHLDIGYRNVSHISRLEAIERARPDLQWDDA